MKVGIVTQPLLNNYGGVLQNFAMQRALVKLGHEPITIDYIPQMTRGRYAKLWLRGHLYNLLHSKSKKSVPESRIRVPRHPYFAQFVEQYIATTKIVNTYSPNLVSEYKLEAVVTGSDQVWRPRYNRRSLKSMFLDFVEDNGVIKFAYAASFGVDNWEFKPLKTLKCRALARRLDYISVREESGVSLCKKNLRVEAMEVLDPTLLLTAEEYGEVLAAHPRSDERYIAAYILDSTPEKIALVAKEAERRGVNYRIYGAGRDVELSVEEWLTMIRDAECVITDSFHGCVFSIIFRREFVAIINRSRGACRFISLLGKFGLLDRIVIDAQRGVLPTNAIEWSRVEEVLKRWQRLSIDYLNRALCR